MSINTRTVSGYDPVFSGRRGEATPLLAPLHQSVVSHTEGSESVALLSDQAGGVSVNSYFRASGAHDEMHFGSLDSAELRPPPRVTSRDKNLHREGVAPGGRSEKSTENKGEKGRAAIILRHEDPLSSRLKYYNRLAPSSEVAHHFRAPDHVVWEFMPYNLFNARASQGSFATIFSIWNVMVGSGLLSMPWAFSVSGCLGATAVMIIICLCCYYTAAIIVKYGMEYEDFADMCLHIMGPDGGGKTAYYFAKISSIALLVMVLVVYLTLIADFFDGSISSIVYFVGGDKAYHNLKHGAVSHWYNAYTLPTIIAIALFPLLNLRDMGPLVKVNSFGIASVLYMILFMIFKGGYKMANEAPPLFQPLQPHYYFLAGIAMVSFFVHNAILPIMRNKSSVKHNLRDLGAAFFLVFMTYFIVGMIGYLARSRQNIPQNYLDIYDQADVPAFVARLFLFVQLAGIFPLLCYIVRIQLFGMLLNVTYPGFRPVFGLNTYLTIQTVLIATFFPYIGTVLRFGGAITGPAYMFVLPVLAFRAALLKKGPLPLWFWPVHLPLWGMSAAVMISQFLP